MPPDRGNWLSSTYQGNEVAGKRGRRGGSTIKKRDLRSSAEASSGPGSESGEGWHQKCRRHALILQYQGKNEKTGSQ